MAKKPPTGGDYDIGWCKPPKHTQWKKKQSGNMRGRPAGRLNNETLVKMYHAVLFELMVPVKGKRRGIPMLHAILLTHSQRALQGDQKAAADILDRAERLAGSGPSSSDVELSEEDEAILREAFGLGNGGPGPVDPPDGDAAAEP